ncbi:MAG: LysM peptidoglycan-binding domain-containing protein [Bacillota bacterium]
MKRNDKRRGMRQENACPGGILFAVRPGQTLSAIARLFSVTLEEIREANPGLDPARLSVGQIICIPGVADRVCRRGRLRMVRRGETLFLIAREEGIPLSTLIEANSFLPDPTLVFPGEQICIPLVVTTACCLVLEPGAQVTDGNFRGVALIEPAVNGGRVTISAVGLPSPTAFGNFDTYLGSLVFREIERLIQLGRVAVNRQPAVWTGARTVDVPPLGANLVVVFPFNSQTEERGPDVLRGLVINCQNG